ncbi:hypothetical protein QQF64_002768 [Cirrhinus molitorella]|uniref:Uncharacterized protein n=1 Tax=Cirrhinus molitorella TaxID=172907 RepID=A0ABR3MR16_9TELE
MTCDETGLLSPKPCKSSSGVWCGSAAQLEVNWSRPAQKMINLARVHDKYGVKKFWEEKIESYVERVENEDSRMKSSALSNVSFKKVMWISTCIGTNLQALDLVQIKASVLL